MKNKTTFIQKIPSCYVGSDCIQMMVPYYDGLTIVNKDGICYHHIEQSTNYINKYLEDDRRLQFPYSNIPFHTEIKGIRKYNLVNQLYDYNSSYFLIGYGYALGMEAYAIKDGKDAYLVRHVLDGSIEEAVVNRCELENIFTAKENEKIYILYPFGGIMEDYKYLLSDEEELKKIAKNKLLKYIYGNVAINDSVKTREIIDSFDNGSYDANIPLFSSPVVKVVLKNNDLFVDAINVKYVRNDCYRVYIGKMPLTKYTLNQIKNIGIKIKKSHDPKISRLLNPNISKEDIAIAKNKVLELKKNN